MEIIVMDGGSNDGTVEILDQYSSDITRWVSKKDRGLYDAWNEGFKLSKGSIVRFVADDDIFLNGRTSTFVQFFKNHSEVAVAAGSTDFVTISSDGSIHQLGSTRIHGSVTPALIASLLFFMNMWVVNESTFFRRSSLPENPFNIHYSIAADLDLQLRLLSLGKRIEVLHEVVQQRVVHAAAKSESLKLTGAKEAFHILLEYRLRIDAYLYLLGIYICWLPRRFFPRFMTFIIGFTRDTLFRSWRYFHAVPAG
jgi:glycosyltransferase involved in cell wall biosynthesis